MRVQKVAAVKLPFRLERDSDLLTLGPSKSKEEKVPIYVVSPLRPVLRLQVGTRVFSFQTGVLWWAGYWTRSAQGSCTGETSVMCSLKCWAARRL